MDTTSLPSSITDYVKSYQKEHAINTSRRIIPVSVKTRIGYEKIVTKEWISTLLETEPATISIHGRTLKQMYTGEPNWEEIGKAAEIIKKTKTLVLGNGNVTTLADAHKKVDLYKLDGILIGRGAFGNPWVFTNHVATDEERLAVALEHCEAFMRFTPQLHFVSLRKHLAWYMKGMTGSHEIKNRLMKINTISDVRSILSMV